MVSTRALEAGLGRCPTRQAVFSAFSLLEMLVAMAVLLLIGSLLASVVGNISHLTQHTTGKIEEMQTGRFAFDRMTRMLSRSQLNEYLDYYNRDIRKFMAETSPTEARDFVPQDFRRYSDLQFRCGPASELGLSGSPTLSTHGVFFQAPAGYSETTRALPQALNAIGYFIEYGSEQAELPPFVAEDRAARGVVPVYQFRLKEVLQPTEKAAFYQPTKNWIAEAAGSPGNVHTLARDVIALILLPKEGANAEATSLSSDYRYNSRISNATPQPIQQHRLPPVLQVAMVVLNRKSAARVCLDSNAPKLIEGPNGEELFTKPERFSEDLQALGKSLTQKRLSYRIFNTEIPLNSSL